LLRASPGTYVLKLSLPKNRCVRIGQLGHYSFQSGTYLYFGSAFGPGGVAARICRHLGASGNQHWHCDYLIAYSQIEAVYFSYAPTKLECSWTRAVAQLSYTSTPVPGFGASDCKKHCRAHLVYISDSAGITFQAKILILLASQTPNWPVYVQSRSVAKQAKDHS
jgi:Uri superfamily endonuclease